MKPCAPQNRGTGELPTFPMRLLRCWDTSYTSQQMAAVICCTHIWVQKQFRKGAALPFLPLQFRSPITLCSG